MLYKKIIEANEDYWYERYKDIKCIINTMVDIKAGLPSDLCEVLHSSLELKENYIEALTNKIIESEIEKNGR